jgi:DNA-binding NarL/FixJ family response regulator
MSQSASILFLSSDESLCSALGKQLGEHVVVRRAVEPGEALTALSGVRWAAFIVDSEGLEGQELEFLTSMRTTSPITPGLVLARRLSAALINGAHTLRLSLMAKPADMTDVAAFVGRAVASKGLSDEHVRAFTNVLSARLELDPREADLFAYVLERESRDDVLRRWQVSEHAFQAHVRSLLRKCEVRTLDALAKRVLIQSVLYRVNPELVSEPSGEHELGEEPEPAKAQALSKAAV